MGSLTSETYPSGRVITTQYDAMERASSVAGALASLGKNYVTQATYMPHGGIGALPMGNNVWQVYSYNSRLQVQRIEDAVNNDPSQVLLDQQFDWGTTNNNGNLNAMTAQHGGTSGTERYGAKKPAHGYGDGTASYDKNCQAGRDYLRTCGSGNYRLVMPDFPHSFAHMPFYFLSIGTNGWYKYADPGTPQFDSGPPRCNQAP